MKKRVIAAVVLLPLLLIVVLVLPKIFTAILLGVMAAIGAYELLVGTGANCGHSPVWHVWGCWYLSAFFLVNCC